MKTATLIALLAGARTACVVDLCEDSLCLIETPTGEVIVPRQKGYKEGDVIPCPSLLVAALAYLSSGEGVETGM